MSIPCNRLIFIILLFFSLQSAASPVWQVSSAGSSLYLAGTVHLLKSKDYPLPNAFNEAYRLSKQAVFETDIGTLLLPETQQKLTRLLYYPPDKSLKDVLSESLYQRLNRSAQGYGFQQDSLLQMTPAGVMMVLLSLEMQRLNINQAGPDILFYQRALEDGKKVVGLESAEQHLSYLAGMGKGNEQRFVENLLAELGDTETQMEQLVSFWRKGELPEIEQQLLVRMKREFPELYTQLVIDRNNRWLPKIEAMLATPEKEIILVGIGHLAGEGGLLHLLGNKGYDVRQLK